MVFDFAAVHERMTTMFAVTMLFIFWMSGCLLAWRLGSRWIARVGAAGWIGTFLLFIAWAAYRVLTHIDQIL